MSDDTRPRTAAILTLGCKLNIADSEAMARRLRDGGWLVTDRAAGADAVIVNSCSVTGTADRKSRQMLRAAHRQAPGATVALTGCLVETASPEGLAGLPADLVYRQPEQIRLAEKIIDLRGAGRSTVVEGASGRGLAVASPQGGEGSGFDPPGDGNKDAANAETSSYVSASAGSRTRAFISAQEGCNDVCAFCIIPKTRGRERSKTVQWVVAEALKRQVEGVQEIVITGTQLGHYGSDLGIRGYDLFKALLAETSIPRIRMSSVQPRDLDDDLIGLWADARMCRHFHLSLQSGSEGVLRRMRRRYAKNEYRQAVWRLREAIPGVAITTDVIAGFPGETEDEFRESLAFCEEMRFAGIHVFPYSQRPGTTGFKMAGQVAEDVKKQRVRRLMELARRMGDEFRSAYQGSEAEVLWERRREGGAWEGLTDTYVRVRAFSERELTNRITLAQVTGLDGERLMGEVIA